MVSIGITRVTLKNYKMKIGNFFKNSIRFVLNRFNLRIHHVPKNKITGFNLGEDLQKIITQTSPVCLDVGANIGQTIKLFETIFESPLIYSFEPSKKIFEKLKAGFSSPQTRLYNYALGKEITRKEFINYEQSTMSSFLELSSSDENRFRNMQVIDREEVEVKTVDWFLEQENISSVDILKIDTQGFDIEVLRGAIHSFEKGIIRNVIIEINFIQMYNGQGTAQDISQFLADYGLHLVDYYEKARKGKTLAWASALFGKR